MSQIKGKNTKPEMLVRKFLHANGFRYRLHVKNLPGSPDIVLPKYKAVIFVHGCFFHHHTTHIKKWPVNNGEFWIKKITGNVERDKKVKKELKKEGWKVITIWQCQLGKSKLNKSLTSLQRKLLSSLKSN